MAKKRADKPTYAHRNDKPVHPYRRVRTLSRTKSRAGRMVRLQNDGGRDAPLTAQGERMWRIADVILGIVILAMIVGIVLTR